MATLSRFLRSGGSLAWGLVAAAALVLAASTALLATTAEARYRRDVTRMVFNDNLGLLESIKKEIGATHDTLRRALSSSSPVVPDSQPYIVVSIADHRLWYKQGERVLFTTRVATGSGKVLDRGGRSWKFETPRGRLVVQEKEQDPAWVPPDWHFVEQANKRGLGITRLERGKDIVIKDGAVISVVGNDVVKRAPDGTAMPLETADGREIVANGSIVIPPFGTNQRRYKDVLGSHRLLLGDGYALHGTNQPQSIGQSVSHGCVRLRNEDIETLYRIVPVGTAVYIY